MTAVYDCLICGKPCPPSRAPSKCPRTLCSKECLAERKRRMRSKYPHPAPTLYNKTCKVCGKAFITNLKRKTVCRSRPRCYQKKAGWVIPVRSCPDCKQDFKPKTRTQIYCNKSCARKARIRTYDCQHCGKNFRPKKSERKFYCSRPCSDAARRAKGEASRARRMGEASLRDAEKIARLTKTCEACSATFVGKSAASKRCDHCKQPKPRLCIDCGIVIKRKRRCFQCGELHSIEVKNQYRQGEAHKAQRRKNRKRRRELGLDDRGKHLRKARKFGAQVIERFGAVEVFDRDGWTCWICEQPIDRSVKAPHPLSYSLDHVIPLSWGGDHSRENTRCAHLGCNVKRGDNVDFAQAFEELRSKGSTIAHAVFKDFGPVAINLLDRNNAEIAS